MDPRKLRLIAIMICLVASGTLVFAASRSEGIWMAHVPEKDRARQNPFANRPDAAAGGARLFAQNCASCHGEDANGKGDHPSLRTERVRTATPGELQWLLTNGSMKNGMPSWSKLPEQQRWQIVSYLKSLQ